MFRLTAAGVVAIVALGCSNLSLDEPPPVIHARFDPDAKVIPMPTDILRDADQARLDIPLDDDDLTDAERELFTFMNTLDGWSTTSSATVEFTGAINAATVTADNLQVWQWRETPRRITDARITIDADEMKVTIDPPRTGWERGGTYFIMLRGGEAGVEGKQGELLECDAAFYFLRLQAQLDVPEHERAFPGDTRGERQENASDLEDIRSELARYFAFFEGRGIERTDVAALWSFTITERTELAMDKASQRMPLPINLLIDPDTKRVDLPPADWDSQVVLDAKEKLKEYDGFGVSSSPMFGFTGPIDVDTINEETVQLYRLGGGAPEPIPAKVTVMEDLTHVQIEPEGALEERTRYGVVVSDQVRDAEGKPIITMPVGQLLKQQSQLFADGESRVGMVEDADARKLEIVRGEVSDFLTGIGRDDVLTAWTFTTMSVETPLEDWMKQPELLNVRLDPENVTEMTGGEAIADFPLGLTGLFSVGKVYNGTIQSPVYLDPLTRGFRTDGGHSLDEIPFTMTVPRNFDRSKPLPVVIFGHGVMCERRFVLAVADAFASRGYAAIAIDFPYHGERTYCWSEGPLSVPDPQTGELTGLEPCQSGYTCHEDGKCKDASGQGNALNKWPVIGMYSASGAAFIEIEHIANTRDHFRQSLIDLSALSRSLRKGDWESVIGAPLKTDKLYYAGQSLGGIIGASFIAFSPEIERAVLNVPGADTVDMFDDSDFFSQHVDAFFVRENVDRASYEGQRFLNVARWFMDATDPQSFWHRIGERDAFIQMATLDFIIPNEYTIKLADESGIPRRDYVGEHAFIVVPVEPAYPAGTREMANFIDGSFRP
jgi:pimeloyl-ACP methyl ester carboxylesterase